MLCHDIKWRSIDADEVSVEGDGRESIRTWLTGYFKSLPSVKSELFEINQTGAYVVFREHAMWTGKDGQPRSQTAKQLAVAVRDEVLDLEAAGLPIIQIDEPALREGLPLRRAEWPEYLKWAVDSFRLAANGARDETQIHTHMCYCEFEDILASIAEMDADVISIETSRSKMELLAAFAQFRYPNDIGPGVWDIHSPRVPSADEMLNLLRAAAKVIPKERLWVNPDCGLKTRRWEEVKPALRNFVAAAHHARAAA